MPEDDSVSKTTNTTATPWKELQAFVDELEETVHRTTAVERKMNVAKHREILEPCNEEKKRTCSNVER